jgi:F-type H+-transporting ATPase subunit alpha
MQLLNVIEKEKKCWNLGNKVLNDPYTVEDQVAIIYTGSKNVRNIPVNKVEGIWEKIS